MSRADPSGAILELYKASLEPGRWGTALEAVAHVVGGCAAVMEFSQASDSNMLVQVAADFGYDPQELISIMGSELAEMDPWWACVENEPHSDLYIGTKYVPATTMRNSPFYNEGLRATGADWRDVLSVVRPLSNGTTGIFSVYRDGQKDDFGHAEYDLMQALKPHIAQALEIAAHLQGQEMRLALADELSSARNDAVVFLDINGKIVHLNPCAEKLFHTEPPVLVMRFGELRINNNPLADRKLQMAIRACALSATDSTAPFTDTIRWQASHRFTPYTACFTPYARQLLPYQFAAAPQKPAMAITIRDFRINAEKVADRARQAFGLTTAETRILAQLLDGASTAMLCDRLGVTLNTVKTQIKAIFRKTGTSSQTDLVRLVLAGFHV